MCEIFCINILASIFVAPPVKQPSDPCFPSPCGPYSQCRNSGGNAVCSCLPNYVGNPPNCRPECLVCLSVFFALLSYLHKAILFMVSFNCRWIRNVHLTRLVFNRNVWIHAKELAEGVSITCKDLCLPIEPLLNIHAFVYRRWMPRSQPFSNLYVLIWLHRRSVFSMLS